jgi:hypothetical protein
MVSSHQGSLPGCSKWFFIFRELRMLRTSALAAKLPSADTDAPIAHCFAAAMHRKEVGRTCSLLQSCPYGHGNQISYTTGIREYPDWDAPKQGEVNYSYDSEAGRGEPIRKSRGKPPCVFRLGGGGGIGR